MKPILSLLAFAGLAAPAAAQEWESVRRPDPTAEETRTFMKRLLEYVRKNHLKQDPNSPQRGMVYEYFDTGRKGKIDQWVQGEALDTMHDGAWFGAALANAARATGDDAYRSFLKDWLMPFYCRMLNHSDALFTPDRDDSDRRHTFGRTHMLIAGEKGFVPYWWDDGASVSLEANRKKTGKASYPCRDELAGQPNPHHRLSGYSLGCSNHMAQDLAVLVQQGWLLFRKSDPKLAARIAEAAKNLHESRVRHHGHIPAVVAAAALSNDDADLKKRIPTVKGGVPSNVYARCLSLPGPDRPTSVPGFADNQQYVYYSAIAKGTGTLPRALAFRLLYDAYTLPMLFRYHSDDAEVRPGINRFDLTGLSFRGGKPVPYRSDRRVPLGSRMGPQNMIVSGWALQALEAFPGLWEDGGKDGSGDLRIGFLDPGHAYTLDGKPEPGMSEPIPLGGATLRLVSDRKALLIAGRTSGERLTLRIFSGPDGTGSSAEVTLHRAGPGEAKNEKGAELRFMADVRKADGGFSFELALPYTVAKGQGAWANPIEWARYSIASGEARRNFRTASSEKQVRRALRRELAQGLRTWEAIFDDLGYIPTGINRGGRWDRFSDSGGYAHLLSAASQYLFVLQGKRDWEEHFSD